MGGVGGVDGVDGVGDAGAVGDAGDSLDWQAAHDFLATIRVGDLCHGVVAEITPRQVSVILDGFAGQPSYPLGTIGALDLPWDARSRAEAVKPGQRITAEVIAVDPGAPEVQLSLAATSHPELWGFLKRLQRGALLSGAVAAIRPFGVFVALDDGPEHPVFPGVGFITVPELSWLHFDDASEVVRVGERVTCEFLQFDTSNGEARLSLRAVRPDPFRAFAEATPVGRTMRGRVVRVLPFGVLVEVTDGVVGLVPLDRLAPTEVDGVRVGDSLSVVVAELDRERRRLTFSLPLTD